MMEIDAISLQSTNLKLVKEKKKQTQTTNQFSVFLSWLNAELKVLASV